MNRLLKLQFFRVVRDKQAIIILSVALGYALVCSILFGLVFKNPYGTEFVYSNTSLILSLSVFSPTNGIFLMFPIAIIVFFFREANYGTMRNQIVSGYSKGKIFFADALFIGIIGISFFLVCQLMTFGITSLLGMPPFLADDSTALSFAEAAADFGKYWEPFLVKLLGAWMTTLLELVILAVSILVFKNIPLPLLFSVILAIVGFYAVFVILIIVTTTSMTSDKLDNARKIMEFFPSYQRLASSDFLGMTNLFRNFSSDGTNHLFPMGLPFILKTVFVNLGLGSGLLVGGYFVFKNTDMK